MSSCKKCPKPVFAKGLCRMHYDRRRRYGGSVSAGMIGNRAPFQDRFVNNVQVHGPMPADPLLGPCQVWTGYRHVSGFGAIWSGHRLLYVHRVAYEATHGPIPPKGRVKQVCGNRLCVRPDHLSLV